jgi:hypothetical protein
MGLHANEYAGKRSTLRLDKKETTKIIGCANGQYAAKLEKSIRRITKESGKKEHLVVDLTESRERRDWESKLANF